MQYLELCNIYIFKLYNYMPAIILSSYNTHGYGRVNFSIWT